MDIVVGEVQIVIYRYVSYRVFFGSDGEQVLSSQV